ncbi:TetR/AcrR family transcriptional regulator [Actinopolymorpha sp. B11F2]|uniref:TetR/AcrR family transcriptional regulator n=1 Tax=Actinopolymorpha sp. B11F2 TaxID=3160862 RepID=UPI0032E48D76
MSPEDRRAALIDATIPLVATHGSNVTTRQIAEAAGIAEGTIFRVFPDKAALIQAALTVALDTAPLLDEIGRIDLDLPLSERMTRLTGILQRRLIQIIGLITAVGMHHPPDDVEAHRAKVRPTNELIHEAIARVLEPDRDELRCSLHHAARLVRLVTFSGSHFMITDGDLLTPEEIAAVLLDGVRRHHPPGEHRC